MISSKRGASEDTIPDVVSTSHIPVLEKFNFSQSEYSLIAFCSDIQLKMQNILPNIPVFILQTGDESYMFRKKFEHIVTSEIELVTPRVVVKIDDIQIQSDQNSYQYVPVNYHFNNRNWTCLGRRQELLFSVTLNLVSPNFPMALRNHMILSSLLSHDNTYTYEFCANTYEASYSLTGTSKEEPAMEVSSATKNWNMPFSIDLRVPVFMPRVESIKSFDEAGMLVGLRPIFNIEIKQDGTTTDYATLIGGLPEDVEGDDYGINDQPEKTKNPNSDLKIYLPVVNPVEMNQKEGDLSPDNT